MRSLATIAERVEAVQLTRAGDSRGAALLRLLTDVLWLLKDLATDARVPWRDKVVAGAAVAYLVSPVDLVPDFVPVVGQGDDLVVAVLAFRRLLNAAGYDVIYELWRGSDEGLALVLAIAGVER